MLSYLAKQIIKKYKPTIVAIISEKSDINPAMAISAALSGQFLVSASEKKIVNKNDAAVLILGAGNDGPQNVISNALGALFSWKKNWPEIIVLNISGKKALENLKEFSDFLKFDFIIAAPSAGKKIIFPEEMADFTKEKTRIIVKYSDKNSIPAIFKKDFKVLTYGSRSADIFSSDMIFQSNGGIKGVQRFGISFKINYKGTILPIRITRSINDREVCNCLIAVLLGVETGVNLVESSSALQNYHPLSGMAIVAGIKRSAIIDNSENYNLDTVFQALDVLPKLKSARQLIVAGDILGLGFEAEQKHRDIGKKICLLKPDMVFCVGNRANFIAEELRSAHFPAERIFKFDNINEVEKTVQPKIKEDDLILVTGSREMGLKKLVCQIMADPPFIPFSK